MDIWPPDEFQFYDSPKVTIISAGGSVWQQIVPADTDRRVLILTSSGGATIRFSPDPSVSTISGLVVTAGTPTLVFSWAEHRALVNSAWYGFATLGQNMIIITLAMPRNPKFFGYPRSYAEREGDEPDGGNWNYQSGPSGIFLATPLPADLVYRLKSISPGLWGEQ